MMNPPGNHPINPAKGLALAELLLVCLAGIGGLAAAFQQKALPSPEEAEKAFAKLEKDPADPDANTTFGKHKAFVMGDFDAAMPYLVHSKDQALKSLAEHELDEKYTATPLQKITMGDEWIAAAKKSPAISRVFFDRASQWYAKAWPDLDAVWKMKSRDQGRKLAAARPPGAARKGIPAAWFPDPGLSGVLPSLDGAVAHTGSYSVKLAPADEKVARSYSCVKSDLVPINGKALETTIFVLSDGTESGADRVYNMFFDQAGNQIKTEQAFIPTDLPFWTRVVIKSDVPKEAVRAQFSAVLNSKKGAVWLDDLSLKFDGKDAMKNGSLEDK